MNPEIIKNLINDGFDVFYITIGNRTEVKKDPVNKEVKIKKKYQKKAKKNDGWRHKPRVGKVMREKIRQCRRDGYSSEEAAKELGLSVEVVNKYWVEKETL